MYLLNVIKALLTYLVHMYCMYWGPHGRFAITCIMYLLNVVKALLTYLVHRSIRVLFIESCKKTSEYFGVLTQVMWNFTNVNVFKVLPKYIVHLGVFCENLDSLLLVLTCKLAKITESTLCVPLQTCQYRWKVMICGKILQVYSIF